MNNSQVVPLPEESPNMEAIQEREAKLVRIIHALQEVGKSPHWSSLKEEEFDGLAKRLKSRIFTEARKESPNTNLLNRLSGQLEWAEGFADLDKLVEKYRKELVVIRNRLQK